MEKLLKHVITNGKSNGGFMNKLVKISALFLLLSAPGAFAGITICEFNNPNTGTTPGCTDPIVGGGPDGNPQILSIYKNGEHIVLAHKYTDTCDMGLSSKQDEYSLVLLSKDLGNYCANNHYRIDTK